MRLRTARSLEILASVGLLLLGARCSSGSSDGTDTAGSGGAPASGGTLGLGGAVGTGGLAQGTGGEAAGSGGRATGGASARTGGRSGRGTGGTLAEGTGGGPVGSGGLPGVGGTTSPTGVEPGRDGGPAVKRDSAPDAPAPPADASSGPDGTCVPDYACKPVAPNTGDPYADCVARVNQFRACVCLPPLGRWTDGEACANQDAQYDSEQATAHAGAQANICDWGNAQDECPDWKRATAASVIDGCLQMMFEEGPPPSGSCTGQCYQDHGHYINMTGTKYKVGVACGFYTTPSGSVWATQNFK